MKKRSERIKEKKEAEKKRHYNELRKTATKGVAMLSVGVALNSVLTSGSIILAANSTSQSKTRYHSNDFLNKLLPDAQNIANDKGLYTSVMLAQAVLESGWGTSKLSKDPYNNLFGIKARPGEDSVDMNTLEDDGTGNYYTIVDGFRVYPSYKESLTDYANFLTGDNGKDQWRYNNYAGVRRENTKTYQDATKALYDANYATDTSYTSKLNTIIESNNLTDFDGDYTPTYTDNSGSNNTATSNSGTYKVVKGDGFYAIERKTGVAVDQILAANGFKLNTVIQPGQVIKLGSSASTDGSNGSNESNNGSSSAGSTSASAKGTYKVVKGDGFYAIERKTGVPVDQILAANGFKLNTVIQPGQVIKLGGASTSNNNVVTLSTSTSTDKQNVNSDSTNSGTSNGETYTVKPKEGFWRISQNTGISVEQIYAANGFNDDTVLQPGQVIKLNGPVNQPATLAASVAVANAKSTSQPVQSNNTKTVTVKAGQGMWRIAFNNGLTLDEFKKINNFSNDHVLKPGDVVKVK